MKLSLRDRQTGDVLAVQAHDGLLSSDTYVQRLIQLYQHYDVLCHCTPDPVAMHIRHRADTDLYFLADNPTSNQHTEDCPFHSFRKTAADNIPEEKLTPLHEFHPYLIREQLLTKGKKSAPYQAKLTIPMPVKVCYTLIENAFVNFTFGKYLSFKQAIDKIINSASNQRILTPWGKTITQCIHYGPSGLTFAIKSLANYQSENKSIPTAIWFGYAPADTQFQSHSLTYHDTTLTFERLHMPFNATGPYLLMGFIPKSALNAQDSQFKDLVVIPVVSAKYFLPIHTNEQREFALNLLPQIFGLNNSKDTAVYLRKPLLPLVENGKALTVDWLLSKKSASGKATVVIDGGNRASLLQEVYATKVISPSDVPLTENIDSVF